MRCRRLCRLVAAAATVLAGCATRPYPTGHATPLHEAALRGDLASFPIPLGHHAALNAVDERGRTPLCAALSPGPRDANDEAKRQIALRIIEAGVRVNARSVEGDTPLLLAVLRGDKELVQVLLARGARVNVARADGRTPLHCDIGNGSDIAALLIAHGADLEAEDADGCTPVARAAEFGCTDCARLLVANGANVNTPRRTPLLAAVQGGHVDIVEFLLAHGANPRDRGPGHVTALHVAANRAVAQFLIDKGADVNARDNTGQTPLFRLPGGFTHAALLIRNGADARAADSRGDTPLHLAVRHGAIGIIGLLLARGADINARNHAGRTPLHDVAASGITPTALLLVERGADGTTPLRLALDAGHAQMANFLRQRGATERLGDSRSPTRARIRVSRAHLGGVNWSLGKATGR